MNRLFFNGQIHTMTERSDVKNFMLVKGKRIVKTGVGEPDFNHDDFKYAKKTDLQGKHIYPCLIDGHTHMLLTIAQMALGFQVCEITEKGVEPHTLEGVKNKIISYASKQKKNAIIAASNYIVTAIDERRMPTKDELDEWAGGRPIVVYNIDGHSTSLSTEMLKLCNIDPEGHSGVLQGEENERTQGRLIDVVGSSIGLKELATGIARFHNYCGEFGINMVGALEGNGDSPKDATTSLIIRLAQHFKIKVRLYLQYIDFDRVKKFSKIMTKLRVGGCGDWEMDGACGSHSAAFYTPYKDTNKIAPCYFTQKEVDELCTKFAGEGYQIASHAIGEAGIDQLLNSLEKVSEKGKPFHRIEHCEFHSDEALERLAEGRYFVMMQPGYAWIDKRYLHSYEQVLPDEIIRRLKFKTLFDRGIIVCGSSDSPVQDMDPYLQMLGMTEFYNDKESVTPYTALTSYTKYAAMALLESKDYGTLEEGKFADFITSDKNFFDLKPGEVVSFRPEKTYYGGKEFVRMKENIFELVKLLLSKKHKI